MNYTPQEIERARERASALNDRKSLSFHLSLGRQFEEFSLNEILEDALTAPNIRNRAAYYNSQVQGNGIRKKNFRD